MQRKTDETMCDADGGSDHTRNKDTILERLNQRNKDRQKCLDSKLDQRNKENVESENADFFAQQFAERARIVDQHIKNLDEISVKKLNVSNGDPSAINNPQANTDLLRLIAGISKEIQDLQRYLTTSTMFLADYKIKSCQNLVNELTNCLDETRTRLAPKKKFGFSGKKVAPKQYLNPKIAAAMQAASTVTTGTEDTSTITNATTNIVPSVAKVTTGSTFEWTLSQRKNEHISLKDEDVNDHDVTISQMKNCLVELNGHAGSVQLSDIHDCIILSGPVSRSLFAENCSNVTIAIACQQLRLHSSHHCRIHLHVTCRAIIEDCHHIEIASYRYQYANIEEDFKHSGLDRQQNNYHDVADFNWLSPDVPSPNWQLLSNAEAGSTDADDDEDWTTALRKKYMSEHSQQNTL